MEIKKANIDRLDLSETIVTGWSAMMPWAVEDNIRLIGMELDILRGLSGERPQEGERIAALITRWEGLRDRLKRTAN